jgi:hypothetical protein
MTKLNLDQYDGPERRRHERQRSEMPARIVMARDTLVFCHTRDLSEGGTCLRGPLRFRVNVGEHLVLAGGGSLGTGRDARVVEVSDGLLHCAFVVA